jgi:hypothetical protein
MQNVGVQKAEICSEARLDCTLVQDGPRRVGRARATCMYLCVVIRRQSVFLVGDWRQKVWDGQPEDNEAEYYSQAYEVKGCLHFLVCVGLDFSPGSGDNEQCLQSFEVA